MNAPIDYIQPVADALGPFSGLIVVALVMWLVGVAIRNS